MDSDLPLDSDIEVNDGSLLSRVPVHLHPWFLAVVWVGGTTGTGTRYLISEAVPRAFRVPVAIVVINLVGAFLLGLLLELLARRGKDAGRRRLLRLLLGTGFLGGFTTYSALAVDTATLFRAGLAGHAVAYALLTVVVGGLASLSGIALGRALHRTASARSTRGAS